VKALRVRNLPRKRSYWRDPFHPRRTSEHNEAVCRATLFEYQLFLCEYGTLSNFVIDGNTATFCIDDNGAHTLLTTKEPIILLGAVLQFEEVATASQL